MIEIDGSIGGGQLLRTAIGLSAITSTPVKVTNIRKGKADAKPGLLPQHMAGVEVVGKFCDAKIEGLHTGSLEVEFVPKKFDVKDRKIDIGTAGSITLLLQTLLPILIFSKNPTKLEIIGGTEVRWAPTIQYFQHVLLGNLKRMKIDVEVQVTRHGYYPAGGGRVVVRTNPSRKLEPINVLDRGNIRGINVESVCGSLPPNIADRQAKAALGIFQENYPEVKLSVAHKVDRTESPGSSITCYAVCDNSVLGGSALGERGVHAERIGMVAAEELLASIKSNAAFDKYAADQLLVFMALADGRSAISVEKITNHVVTNVQVIEKFLPIKFEVNTTERKIGVDGVSFSSYE